MLIFSITATENVNVQVRKQRLHGNKHYSAGLCWGRCDTVKFSILVFLNGGDVDENRHFIERKLVAHGQIFNIFQNFPRCEQLGGDASGNGDFQMRKQRLQGPNCFQELSFYIQ